MTGQPLSHIREGAYESCLEAIDLSLETGVEHAVRMYDCGQHLILVVAPLELLPNRRSCPACGKRAKAKGPIRRAYQGYLERHEQHLAAVRGAPWN